MNLISTGNNAPEPSTGKNKAGLNSPLTVYFSFVVVYATAGSSSLIWLNERRFKSAETFPCMYHSARPCSLVPNGPTAKLATLLAN